MEKYDLIGQLCQQEIEAVGIGLGVLEALDDDRILLSRIACPVCGQPLLQGEALEDAIELASDALDFIERLPPHEHER